MFTETILNFSRKFIKFISGNQVFEILAAKLFV